MPNLYITIIDKNTNYTENIHYEYFILNTLN